MKKIIFTAFCACALFASLVCAADENAGSLRRFALVIGSNDGGSSRVKLRFANQDAQAFVRVMKDLGALEDTDLVMLFDPSASRIREGFASLSGKVKDASKNPGRKEAIIYYSGHSDEEGLLASGERITYSEIRSLISNLEVNVRVAVIDSCSSGAFTRAKGIIKRPAFLIDASSETKGYAFLTSSAEDEVAQESDKIEGSFFTHYLVSGLRGAADSTSDGLVTLNEAYSYAFRETLERTEKTRYGAQHPKYDIQLTGTGDLVLTDLRVTSCGLLLGEELAGRFFVRDKGGRLIAEIDKQPGAPVELGLASGSYEITAEVKGKLYSTEVVIEKGKQTSISRGSMRETEGEATRPRGDTPEIADGDSKEEGIDILGIFHFSLIPELPSFMGKGIHNVSLSLLVDDVVGIKGVEIAAIGSLAEEDITGIQIAGIFNSAQGDVIGVQAAGIANLARNVNGAQIAGLLNLASGSGFFAQVSGLINTSSGITGVQTAGLGNSISGQGAGAQIAGLWNSSDSMSGAQISGALNTAGIMHGAQVGVINAAGRIAGVQVGIINYAETFEGGLPIGLINYVADGIHAIDTSYDDRGYVHADLKTGSKTFYSTLRFAFVPREEPFSWSYGAGFGVAVQIGQFFVNIDATINAYHEGIGDWSKPYSESLLPELTATAGFSIGSFGVFAGVSAGFELPGMYWEKSPTVSFDVPFSPYGDTFKIVPHVFAGIRLSA